MKPELVSLIIRILLQILEELEKLFGGGTAKSKGTVKKALPTPVEKVE